MSPTQTIGGTRVLIDGPPAEAAQDTLLLLHGWPDNATLWNGTVAALADRYRCLRFTWPGFDDGDDKPRARHVPTLDELTALLLRVVQEAAGGPVTLVAHDWGCMFGYHFARLHPQWVRRVVGVDIGDAGTSAHRAELGARGQFAVFAYQAWLAAAWWVGRHIDPRIGTALGDRLARRMAARLRARAPLAQVTARMGYPYWITWTGSHGSYRAARPFRSWQQGLPMLFVYGQRKAFMFHSSTWADTLATQPGSRVLALPTGHWVMLDAAADFHAALRGWLQDTEPTSGIEIGHSSRTVTDAPPPSSAPSPS